MASPGSVTEKQFHDPSEEQLVTDQTERVRYLFNTLRWQGGRRSFERWETDGGNVPAEEQVYLVRGELRRGWWAGIQCRIGIWFKKIRLYFSRWPQKQETQS